jgi:hypothetical protein
MSTTHSKDAILIYFNAYSVHYYAQSSSEWEAAYIHCFQYHECKERVQKGIIIFTYPDGTTPPGLENPNLDYYPTSNRAKQKNELTNNNSFFKIYYSLDRFDDVINQLRYAVDFRKGDDKSMLVSADPYAHVWALCNNYEVQVGAQYKK